MSITSDSQNAKNISASNANVESSTTKNITNPEYSGNEFTRAAIEKLGNLVRVTDKDESTGLELFCYVRCGPNDDRLISQCRGVVFNKDKIVMRAFPYTVEFSGDDEEKISSNIDKVFKDCSFYDAYEGTLIRVFNFDGKWYTSTHRKLNAFRSKWSSNESFGTAFKRALESEIENNEMLRKSLPKNDSGILERFQSILDIKKQYMFLVRHSCENRIVCAEPKRPTLYHVGTFVDKKLVMTENVNIPYPQKHSFDNINQMINYVNKVDIRDLQGIIIFAPDNCQYKILNTEYLELFRARGNEPSIKFRYLQVRMDYKMSSMLSHLYPEMTPTFEKYENILYSIAKVIYNSYVQRHIKGNWSTLPTHEYKVDKVCHSWHEQDRKKNIVTLEKVVEVLNTQPPTNLNHMIRRFVIEKKRQEETQNEVMSKNRSNTLSSTNDSPVANSVASPLLLSKNRKRNHTLPPHEDLGAPALNTRNDTHVANIKQ